MALKVLPLPALALFAMLAASPATAAVIVFEGVDAITLPSDASPNADAAFASFDGATGTLTTLDFESVANGQFLTLSEAALGNIGISISAAGASDGDDTDISTASTAQNGFNTTSGGSNFLLIQENDLNGEPAVGVTFNFSEPISAFGLRVTGHNGSNTGVFSVRFDNGAPQVLSVQELDNTNGHSFFGITDMVTFSSVTFLADPDPGTGNTNDTVGLDNIVFGQALPATSIPLPAAAWMLLAGIGALGVIGRRQV
ncbi:MAG: VPLPA-CTERM sorting domain-containing protein [Pseudomonadota bacterium]